MLANLALIAVALSIDALGIGIAYRVKDVKITWISKWIVCGLSVIMMIIALNFGKLLILFLPENIAKIIGVLILMVMGIKVVLQNIKAKDIIKPKKDSIEKVEPKEWDIEKVEIEEYVLFRWAIKSYGITINVMKYPTECDLDKSSKIEGVEAVFLGIALSVDSLSAGIAVSTFGFNIFYLPIFVGVFQLLFLTIGEFAGKHLIKYKKIDSRVWSILSGLILILLAVIRICSDLNVFSL